jgi:hypothetical protein
MQSKSKDSSITNTQKGNAPPQRNKQSSAKLARTPTKVKGAKSKAATLTDVETALTATDRHRMIELGAFYRAERRGFVPGFEVDDWLAAEAEVTAQLLPLQAPSRV